MYFVSEELELICHNINKEKNLDDTWGEVFRFVVSIGIFGVTLNWCVIFGLISELSYSRMVG